MEAILEDVIYFQIEKVNKVARRYTNQVFLQAGFDVSVDQWLVLKKIHDEPNHTQIEIGEALFKDNASITRLIDQLVAKELVQRNLSTADRRRFVLELSPKGRSYFEQLVALVNEIRQTGLRGVSAADLQITLLTLRQMAGNLGQ